MRNFEVDWQGIVHNSIYLEYFEIGRVEYLRGIGHILDLASINRSSRLVLARNEVDYVRPARFDDLLEIGTKVSLVGTSSFIFEGVIEIHKTKKLIAKNRATHVWLHPTGGYPVSVPEKFLSSAEKYQRRQIPRKIADL